MHVANEALCKELYNLSGWRDTDFGYRIPDGILFQPRVSYNHVSAYDLGYLLRKLPRQVKGYDLEMSCGENWWCYAYKKWIGGGYADDLVNCEADTPENAAAKFCIELLKQGILKGEKQE